MAMLLHWLAIVDIRTILSCTFIFLLISWWIRRPKNLPPGPCGWPVLGYLPNLGIYLYRSGLQPHQFLAELSRRYGKVYCFYLGRQLMVFLNGADIVREAFQNQHLNDRPILKVSKSLKGKGTGVLLASGASWKQQRRFTLSTFRSFGVGKRSFQEQISGEVKVFCEQVSSFKSKSFDPQTLLSNAVSNIICAVVFGKRFEYSDTKFHELLHNLDMQVRSAGSGVVQLFVPILRYVTRSLPGFKERLQRAQQTRAFHDEIINAHRQSFDPTNLNDYIDVYLDEIRQTKENGLSSHINEDNLQATIIQLFSAGSETTVTTLRWALLYIIAYPEVQVKVQREIDIIVGRNRLPNLSDKEQLPYTEATLMEVQRIASIVPLGVPHYSAEDTTLFGYMIPKNTLIMSNIWAIHHDPAVWTAPDEFQPERFLNRDHRLIINPEGYMPFSTGRRVCLGENLAKMELFIFFTHLLHRFTFEKPKDSPPLCFVGVIGATNCPVDFKIQAKIRD